MEGWSIMAVARGFLGMVFIIALCWVISFNRKAINWRTVGIGLAIQLVLALGVLYVPIVGQFFELCGKVFVKVLGFSHAGSSFVFGHLVDRIKSPYVFILNIVPAIIFFSALTSLLFYLGIIQKVVIGIAWLLKKTLRISGPEGLSVASNIFLGMGEAPLLIKKYIPRMTASEVFIIMSGGMATISGAIMGAYIGMLGGGDEMARLFFAKHMISASVMAAPGVLVLSKIVLPHTESFEESVKIENDNKGKNLLSSVVDGSMEGMKLALFVGVMLIAFISLVALINYLMSGVVGRFTGLNDLILGWTDGKSTFTLEAILGFIFAPITWVMGICTQDIMAVGELLGKKLILNEFIAYTDLAQMKNAAVFAEQKSIVMSTYMLCGFANIGSIGICIASIAALAGNQKQVATRYGFHAMIVGGLASCLSATMVGMML